MPPSTTSSYLPPYSHHFPSEPSYLPALPPDCTAAFSWLSKPATLVPPSPKFIASSQLNSSRWAQLTSVKPLLRSNPAWLPASKCKIRTSPHGRGIHATCQNSPWTEDIAKAQSSPVIDSNEQLRIGFHNLPEGELPKLIIQRSPSPGLVSGPGLSEQNGQANSRATSCWRIIWVAEDWGRDGSE